MFAYRTALAEAELEYNCAHESTAILLGISLTLNAGDFATAVGTSLPPECQSIADAPVEAVVWTTTPWSLPANAAIAYNEKEDYTLLYVKDPHGKIRKFYLVATECVPRFQAEYRTTVLPAIRFHGELRPFYNIVVCYSYYGCSLLIFSYKGSRLENLRYWQPWFKNTECPFLAANYVTMEKGTGLVHTAPAHGADDYVTGLKHKLPVVCS